MFPSTVFTVPVVVSRRSNVLNFLRSLQPKTRAGLILLGAVAIGYLAIYALPFAGVVGSTISLWLMIFVIPASWCLVPVGIALVVLGAFTPDGADPFSDS